ncbi:MuDR family transposase, partial [Striga hermonthica]
DFFMLFINHKGRFVTLEGHEYYYGDFVATVTGLDADRLGYFDIEDQIKKLGYENWGRICYKHRTTHEFQDIKDDAGVMACLGQMQRNRRYVEIFVQTEQLNKPSVVSEVAAVCQQEKSNRNRVPEVAVVCQQEKSNMNRVSEVAEVHQAKDTSEKLGEFALDESEDEEYEPSGESSSNDGLSDEDLGTDDEEYLQARREALNSRQSTDDGDANMSFAQPSSHHEADDNNIPTRDNESEYEDSEGNVNTDSSSGDGLGDDDDEARPKKKKILKLESGSVFKCFYVGFSALRQGFLQGCRPIISLDGAFLKTFLGGVLLCAVGKDGNNQIFPLAWAVVDSENESTWKWFLDILFQDLGISYGLGWTFISDQQK